MLIRFPTTSLTLFQLLSLFTSNSNAQISFPQSVSILFLISSLSLKSGQGASFQLPDPLGGLISAFSQYGPTYDLLMKPSGESIQLQLSQVVSHFLPVMAPGGNIISTAPVQLGSFSIVAGTRSESQLFSSE